jgi:cadmium resistance protein CadD (predicted permease)
MNEAIWVAGLALLAFVSTNVDSLLVLVPLLANQRADGVRVVAGYWLAFALVLALAWAGARIADQMIPVHQIGYLGIIPITFGAVGLWSLMRSGREQQPRRSSRTPGVLSTAVLVLSLSGDNLGVLIAFFADKPARLDAVIVTTLAAAALLWAMAARVLAGSPALRQPLERWGPRIVPVLMILVGLHILLDTASDVA